MTKRARGSRAMVVSRHGRYRFQTGMVTARLIERGLPMATAFAISKQLRRRIADRVEVTTAELDAELSALLDEHGLDLPQLLRDDAPGLPVLQTRAGSVPFPRHLVLRDFAAVGFDAPQAGRMLEALELEVRRSGGPSITRQELDAIAAGLLDDAGAQFSRRYRLIRDIREAGEPVVVFIGGATGTGKSTLAMEIAFRLGIRMAVSTDMIRETMRTVLSAEVMPGLHDHSFRGMLQGGAVLSDPRERVLAGFRQQAAQVTAGVRAVIRRALREHSHMVVEGTHLIPPFERYLPSPDVRHAGVILAVPAESRHRDRFPQRAARQPRRDASAYLDAFQSVRWIHDDLLAAAEDAEALVLDTGDIANTAQATLDYLSHALPLRRRPEPVVPRPAPPLTTLFLILDGLADEPHQALGWRTPLQAADTPFLRMLAHDGGQGQMYTGRAEGAIPHTDEGLWAFLGAQSPEPLGRGLFEAMGLGIPLTPGAVLMRGNLATRRADGSLIDRRAGRIRSGQMDLLAGLRHLELSGGLEASVFPGHEHRVVVMLRGPGLSEAVSDTDPGGEAAVQAVQRPTPTDASPEAARTAAALRELLAIADERLSTHPHNAERVARGMLPANCIITRGAASTSRVPRPQHTDRTATLVAACPTALGVARLAGMGTVTAKSMTGNLDTDIDAKFAAAAEALADRPLVVVHFKATDVAAHDRRPVAKRNFISAVDAALGRFLTSDAAPERLRIVVSCDHATSSRTGHHMADPVPVLVGTWTGVGDESDFDENSAAHGALGLIEPGELSAMLWDG